MAFRQRIISHKLETRLQVPRSTDCKQINYICFCTGNMNHTFCFVTLQPLVRVLERRPFIQSVEQLVSP